MNTHDKTRRFARRLLGASLIATIALIGNAQAADAPASTLLIKEQADGSLIAFQPNGQSLRAVALNHQAAAVASDCITLESRSGPVHRQSSVLRNTCAHEVVVSYCVEAASGSARACEGLGKRDMTMARIAAGDTMKLVSQAAADSQVNWVACRGDADAISSLTLGGTRGECLTPASAPLVANAGQ